MNSFRYEDLKIGQKISFTRRITEDMLDKFSEISGDVSPIHVDREYAVKCGYRDRVCQGMLFTSLYSTLAGVYLPGEHCLLHSVEAKYLNIVYPGDVLTCTGEVSELNDSFKLVMLKGTITNQDGVKVSKAKIQLGVRE